MKKIILPAFILFSLFGLSNCTMNESSNSNNDAATSSEHSQDDSISALEHNEKEVLEIAREAAIERFGEATWNKQEPFVANLTGGIWHVTGTLYLEIDGERYENGGIGPDGKPVYMNGGTIEVKISDETLEVIEVYHAQ